jgi:negative regulator of sigma E activity
LILAKKENKRKSNADSQTTPTQRKNHQNNKNRKKTKTAFSPVFDVFFLGRLAGVFSFFFV